MRILVQQSTSGCARHSIAELALAGYRAECVSRPEVFSERARLEQFDLGIIDLGSEPSDWLKVIPPLRSSGSTLLLMILSRCATAADRAYGLDLGADEYLTAPFEPVEFLARLRALARRASFSEPSSILLCDLRIDTAKREVTRRGRRIHLQPREFALLEYLIRNAGRVIPTEEIIEHVWRYRFTPRTNVVASRVCRLREKIDVGFDPQLIHTIKGKGYVLRSAAYRRQDGISNVQTKSTVCDSVGQPSKLRNPHVHSPEESL